MKSFLSILILTALIAPADAAVDANGNTATKQHLIKKSRVTCNPPKRWIEIDALASDAGRPSKVICK